MFFFFFSSRRRHTRLQGDWSSDVCSSDLDDGPWGEGRPEQQGHGRDREQRGGFSGYHRRLASEPDRPPETPGGGHSAQGRDRSPMNREQKAVAIAEIASQIDESDAIFAVDYRGISVSQIAELRGKL